MWTVICRFDNTRIEASEPDSKGMVILRVVSGNAIGYASVPHGTITQGWKYSSANNIAHCGPLMVRFRKNPPTPPPELIEVNLTHRLVASAASHPEAGVGSRLSNPAAERKSSSELNEDCVCLGGGSFRPPDSAALGSTPSISGRRFWKAAIFCWSGDIRFDSVFRINRIRLDEPSVPCDGDNYILAYDNEAKDHPQKVPITIREMGVVKVSEKQFVLDKLITFEPVYAKIIAIYYNNKFQRVEARDITFIGYSP